MTRERYAELAETASRIFRRSRREEPPPGVPVDRRRLVGAVAAALDARARRNVIRRWSIVIAATFGCAATAAVALVMLGPGSSAVSTSAARTGRAGTPAVAPLGGPASYALALLGGAGGGPLAVGTDLKAPASASLRVGSADGTTLTLEPGGRLALLQADATRRLLLRRGAVGARVAKLGVGQRFVIETADAEVEVHGTAFRVAEDAAAARCAGGSTTRVSVTEGVVTVRFAGREERLTPGDEWPAPCAPASGAPSPRPSGPRHASRRAAAEPARLARPAPSSPLAARSVEAAPTRALDAAPVATVAAPPAEEPSPPAASPPAPATPPSAEAPSRAAPIPPSELAAQNDLFAAAVRAKRHGRAAVAARLFASLARRYPESPLVESALAQRMKLLAPVDPEAAAEAATEYLARFPRGFARAEARRTIAAAAKP